MPIYSYVEDILLDKASGFIYKFERLSLGLELLFTCEPLSFDIVVAHVHLHILRVGRLERYECDVERDGQLAGPFCCLGGPADKAWSLQRVQRVAVIGDVKARVSAAPHETLVLA